MLKKFKQEPDLIPQVVKFVQNGQLHKLINTDEALQPHFTRKEFKKGVFYGCITKAKARVVEELHETHPGICRRKSSAKTYIWWPIMDSELEMKVQCYEVCQVNRKLPPKASYIPGSGHISLGAPKPILC